MTDTTTYDEAIDQRQTKEKRKFIEALCEMPIVTRVCKLTGTGRTTYYRWCKEDPTFASECDEAWQQGIEYMCDLSESQLLQLVGEKSLPAIKHWLAHNSPRYQSPMVMRIKPEKKTPERSILELVRELNGDNDKPNPEEE